MESSPAIEEERGSTAFSRVCEAVCAFFVEYSSRSSIHGVKYLGESRRHWTERIFWLVVLAMSAYACSLSVLKFYDKWQQTPVIVSIAEKSTPVCNIPFPAVTICPETKVRLAVVNFTNAYHQMMSPEFTNKTLPEDELEAVEALAQVCNAHLFDDQKIGSKLAASAIPSLLKKIAPNLTETVAICRWRNKLVNCSHFFTGKEFSGIFHRKYDTICFSSFF